MRPSRLSFNFKFIHSDHYTSDCESNFIGSDLFKPLLQNPLHCEPRVCEAPNCETIQLKLLEANLSLNVVCHLFEQT